MHTHYLIVPGYGNSLHDHWQTYFEHTIPTSSRVLQSSWDQPVCSDWVREIQKNVLQYEVDNVVLVSHSLGCIAVVHWAKEYNVRIKGAMMVAPPDIEHPWQDYGFESFVPIPTNRLPFPSLVVASTNDHWASQERTQYFAQRWGSKCLFLDQAGHINPDSGYGNWDEGIQLALNAFG